ncbi:uncharacterized protein LOC119986314 [Tripterygium wilfordii]|uniref:uncharacterized protein LOC119986314 n=1 Tax=Tripterygium wilfordii TaxID=458696 RepID=UPI0018F7E60B|nr:uncharacterized protein LOC119986314 [Tripterygium wilfordii]
MSFTTGSSKDSWHPVMTADTTVTSYWLNWRFLLCGIWVVIVIVFSSLIIWKNEDCGRKKGVSGETKLETERTLLYEDETWRPCLKGIHPAWLLAFRVSSFFVLVVLLAIATVVDGSSIFYYYTQWTFILVTFYFGLGSLFSMYGCYQYHKRVGGDKVDNVEVDAEQGTSAAPAHRQAAGKWAYLFQIIFQMNAGAVLLTDCVFWFILVPLLEIKDYNINPLVVCMHSLNAVFLIGDTALNCLQFPWFRIAYFLLWTIAYVIFQWLVHVNLKIWWPYPFLDLSDPFSPLWYFSVVVMHLLCYAIFDLITRLKHTLYSRWFPDSYLSSR